MDAESLPTTPGTKETNVGRTPSDDYAPGEPGKYGEPYEMIDDVEAGEEDDDED